MSSSVFHLTVWSLLPSHLFLSVFRFISTNNPSFTSFSKLILDLPLRYFPPSFNHVLQKSITSKNIPSRHAHLHQLSSFTYCFLIFFSFFLLAPFLHLQIYISQASNRPMSSVLTVHVWHSYTTSELQSKIDETLIKHMYFIRYMLL